MGRHFDQDPKGVTLTSQGALKLGVQPYSLMPLFPNPGVCVRNLESFTRFAKSAKLIRVSSEELLTTRWNLVLAYMVLGIS